MGDNGLPLTAYGQKCFVVMASGDGEVSELRRTWTKRLELCAVASLLCTKLNPLLQQFDANVNDDIRLVLRYNVASRLDLGEMAANCVALAAMVKRSCVPLA